MTAFYADCIPVDCMLAESVVSVFYCCLRQISIRSHIFCSLEILSLSPPVSYFTKKKEKARTSINPSILFLIMGTLAMNRLAN